MHTLLYNEEKRHPFHSENLKQTMGGGNPPLPNKNLTLYLMVNVKSIPFNLGN